MVDRGEPCIVLDDVYKVFHVWQRTGRLRRHRRAVTAVGGISLAVEQGELCGYIGPNGAGKSTTVKMLTGLLVPSRGRVRVTGMDPQRSRVQLARRIGVVFGQRTQLWWDLPLGDSFDLLRHVYRVPADRHRHNLARLVEVLDLGSFLRTPVRQLSLGQRMRGDLTAALLHDPPILYLDEPTIGLDIVSKTQVRDFLRDLNREEGVTVVLATHDLAEVERLCTRLVVIDHGRVIHDGTVAEIKDRYAPYRTLIVDFDEEPAPLSIPGVEVLRIEGHRQWLRFRRDDRSAAEVVAAVARQARVRDLAIEEPDIENVVSRIYRGETGDQHD